MRLLFPLLLLFVGASSLGAHPFDDRADMIAEIVLTKGADNADRMTLRVIYRYESPFASYNEAFLELDANRDEKITRDEVNARFKTLASDLQAAVRLAVRDETATIVPDFNNFVIADLNDPDASVDAVGGMPITNLRLGYFFKFEVKFPVVWDAGTHPVEFLMASDRIAVKNPESQLMVFDDRGKERRAVTSVMYGRTPKNYARLRFNWVIEKESAGVIEAPEAPPDKTTKPDETNGVGGKEKLFETDKQRRDENSDHARIQNAFDILQNSEAGLWLWLTMLGGLFIWGAGHALMPGHGKTLVASYLIGTQGKRTDALFLGVVVTAAHTSGVYLLLGGAWAFREFWPGVLDNPEKQLSEWITLAVGATIFLMGFVLVMKRTGGGGHHEHDIFGRHVHPEDDHHHDHSHDHGHSHVHGHTHAHDEKRPEDSDILMEAPHAHSHDHHHEHDPSTMSRWEILRLGVLGGVLPCPSAFVIGLVALQQQAYVFGLLLVLTFSVGLGMVLSVIGLALVQTKSYMRQKQKQSKSKLFRFLEAKLPAFGALVITLLGTVMVVFALIRLGFLDASTFTV